jgi:hypothetical protein
VPPISVSAVSAPAYLRLIGACAALACAAWAAGAPAATSGPAGPARVALDENGVTVVDGRKLFPVGFTMPPPPDGRTPAGVDAYAELRAAGGTFIRTGPWLGESWDEPFIEKERRFQDAAARAGLLCLPWLKELSGVEPGNADQEAKLRRVVNLFKDHPGLGCWKGADEPEWGKEPVEPLERAKRIIGQLDPNHPVWIVHAPRGTVESLRRYNNTMDILGLDIYPVSYPPGAHSLLPNREISLVGDHAQIIMEVARGRAPRPLPVWMTLQIAWSGVAKEGRTLRFPTAHDERFMAYQAVINGARGLIFFGGHLPNTLTPEDRALGWNWRFWERALKSVVQELGDKSPLHPALVAPASTLPVKCKLPGVPHVQYKGVELLVREVGDDIFLFACKREGDTVHVEFSDLPPVEPAAEVMFESPRTVTVTDGKFTDWFAPFDVHVYRFRRQR